MGYFLFWAALSVLTTVGMWVMLAAVPSTETASNADLIKAAAISFGFWGVVTLIIWLAFN